MLLEQIKANIITDIWLVEIFLLILSPSFRSIKPWPYLVKLQLTGTQWRSLYYPYKKRNIEYFRFLKLMVSIYNYKMIVVFFLASRDSSQFWKTPLCWHYCYGNRNPSTSKLYTHQWNVHLYYILISFYFIQINIFINKYIFQILKSIFPRVFHRGLKQKNESAICT